MDKAKAPVTSAKPNKLDDTVKQEIQKLLKQNGTVDEIAAMLSVPVPSVKHIRKVMLSNGA